MDAADCGSYEEISSTELDFIEFCRWLSIFPPSILASEPIQLTTPSVMALLVEWRWRPAPCGKWHSLSLSTPCPTLNCLNCFHKISRLRSFRWHCKNSVGNQSQCLLCWFGQVYASTSAAVENFQFIKGCCLHRQRHVPAKAAF